MHRHPDPDHREVEMLFSKFIFCQVQWSLVDAKKCQRAKEKLNPAFQKHSVIAGLPVQGGVSPGLRSMQI